MVMFSCKKDQDVLETPIQTENAISASDPELSNTLSDEINEKPTNTSIPLICVDKITDSKPMILGEDEDIDGKGVFIKGTKWANGKTLKVFFMNGSDYLRGKVFTYAQRWSNYANIKFVLTKNKAESDIRVGFKINGNTGSWSYFGTDAREYRAGRQTMNFGWFDRNTSDLELIRTTVHEFGHALGLAHEHKSPVNTIQWDRPAVYAYYMGPPNNWTREEVNDQVLNKYKPRDVRNTKYDPESIMHYYIDPDLTLNHVGVGYNLKLSDKDKIFIARIYPK